MNQISENAFILDQLKEQGIFSAYFQIDKSYYLFLYSQNPIELDFFKLMI